MGEVYLARDSRLNRNVALKIIAPGSSDDTVRRRRFAAEARAASSLNHPNIITVHDFGTVDGISYIVSELIEGESVRALIHRGPIPIRELLELAAQMADGLAAAHEAGIVHRDLKPENVMVTRTGRVKILDFGLAKPMLATVETDDVNGATFDGSATQPGLILGTVGYMSPEQARGEAVGIASDQFSFGVILHEMATGIPAFKRETPMQTLLAIANVDRMPFTPGPVGFRLLVERCLSKDPAQRFGSTSELRDKLQRVLDSLPRPLPAAPEEPSVSEFESSSGAMIGPATPPRPSRKVATAVLGGLALFSLGLLAARIMARSPAPDIASYRFVPMVSSSSIDAFPALSPSGRTIAYSEPVDGIFQIFTEQSTASSRIQRTKSTQDCFYPVWSPDGIRLYYISGPDLWSASESGGTPELVAKNVLNADVSPQDGTLALVRRGDIGFGASIWLLTPGSEPKRVNGVPLLLHALVKFSPDGRRLGVSAAALEGPAGFWEVSLPKGGVQHYPADLMRGFSFLPDGRHILYGAEHLWRSETHSGKSSVITAGSGHENWPAVARDGHEAVFSTAASHYDVIAFPTGMARSQVRVPPPSLYSNSNPAWSPKRSEFAYVTERSGTPEIRLRDAGSGWERKVARPSDFPNPTMAFSDLAFSPDGQRIAYTRATPEGASIWISNPAGEAPVHLAKGTRPVWSPDGNWMAFTTIENHQLTTRKLHLGSSQASLIVKSGLGETLAWSPDGAWILTISPNGTLFLLSPDGKSTQQAGRAVWLSATWARDGSHILGLRRSTGHTLEAVNITRAGVEDGSAYDWGPFPPALSFAIAAGFQPVTGFSLAPDGNNILVSMLRVQSDLWKATGL